MRRDPAHPPADRECDLDDFVENRRIAGGTPGAVVVVAVDALQRLARLEHAAAARAQHVPRQLENPEPGSVQKCGDRTFFIEMPPCREIQHVDAAKRAIRGVLDQRLDGVYYPGI